MKSIILHVAVVMIAVLQMAPDSRAQLRVMNGPTINLGKIYTDGKVIKRTVRLKNVGTDTVIITAVRTSCGCTAAIPSRSTLAPSQTTTLSVTFDPTGYTGPVTKYIYVMNTFKEKQSLTITMTGTIAQVLKPTPGYIVFNNVRINTDDTVRITLTNITSSVLRIEKVEGEFKEMTFRLSNKRLGPGESCVLTVRLHLTEKRDINGFVHITTSSRKQPVTQIRVFAGVVG